ncbi:CRISPR-associated endonuclease Cas2 [Candidatus Kaiserbacteria bacterium CG_4_8_14_3_um_filter_38_9]|uniref:CRISPR-associated endoribonuclease Cas2 n=1 Tax=Candidatus Kaiserbacteria bacterium CG_4_8_14_3_um_filter_38_9 TaxID=1974599 RepID=A0A2M7IN18_9BACT|nr:MAG: CRISPR-associated endonuclease Cas2 [Candidatus Kaiserbacteria bacterium CG_4_8_14_3_um_filter_38_9]
MIMLSYDISNNKVRTKFSKFLKRFGRRVQCSVFEINNSQRVLQNILKEIELVYKKKFTGADSVLIFQIGEADKRKIIRYGYAKNEESEIVIFS